MENQGQLLEQLNQQFGKGYFFSNQQGKQWIGKMPAFDSCGDLLRLDAKAENVFFNGTDNEWKPSPLGNITFVFGVENNVSTEAVEIGIILNDDPKNNLVVFTEKTFFLNYLKERDWLPTSPESF
jgi:hypothetical protein